MKFERASQIRKAILKKNECEMSKITKSELIDYIYYYHEDGFKMPSLVGKDNYAKANNKPVRPLPLTQHEMDRGGRK